MSNERVVDADFDCRVNSIEFDRQTAIEIGNAAAKIEEGAILKVTVDRDNNAIKYTKVNRNVPVAPAPK